MGVSADSINLRIDIISSSPHSQGDDVMHLQPSCWKHKFCFGRINGKLSRLTRIFDCYVPGVTGGCVRGEQCVQSVDGRPWEPESWLPVHGLQWHSTCSPLAPARTCRMWLQTRTSVASRYNTSLNLFSTISSLCDIFSNITQAAAGSF